jgi:predicted nucleic acid-binding protein
VTLVDTNVILDIVTDDPHWRRWSQFSLDVAFLAGPLIINDIVYAEISVRYESVEVLDTLLEDMGIRMESMPRTGLFLAAKVYRRYRGRGGTRSGVLSDFFIGAHAAVKDYTLLTRDPAPYRSYFPTLRLIVPE